MADLDPAIPMAGLVAIAPAASLAVFDLPPGGAAGHGQIDGALDGVALPRPVLSTRLALRSGGTRCVVLVRRAAADLARTRLEFRLAGRPVAFTDPDWLQSPLRPCDDLIDGLAATAVPRLVRFLLPNLGRQMSRDGMPDFRATVLALLDRLDVAQGTLAAQCRAGRSGLILTYRLSGNPGALPADATLLGQRGADVVARLATCAEGGDLLHVFLPRADPLRSVDIVFAGAQPLHLMAESETAPRSSDLKAWLDRRPAAVRAWADAELARAAGIDAGLAAQLAECRVQPGEGPQIARVHVAATRGGLLVWADIADPHGLSADLRIQCGARSADVAVPPGGRLRTFLRWQGTPDGSGAPARPGDAARLGLCGRSGRTLAMAEVALADMGAAIPDCFAGAGPDAGPNAGPDAAAWSVARAWSDRVAPDLTAVVQPCGPEGAPPRLTLLVPLTPDPDLIRARAALVAGEPAGHGVEIDCLATARPSPAMLALLAQVARVTGVAHRVLVLPDGTAPADALVAGLRATRAPAVTLLGATVLPEGPGWLASWLAALGRLRDSGILGGTVLHPDGSVHHAGGRLAMSPAATAGDLPMVAWTGTGLPVADLGSGETLRSDLFTRDAVGLTAAGRAAILAAGPCLPDPDLMLLPAILRAGAGQVALSSRFVRFGGPAAPDLVLQRASLRLIADAAGDVAPQPVPTSAPPAPAIVDTSTTEEAA